MATSNVVDMDACHMKLGRPWKFDVNVIHRDKYNNYLFSWKGKKGNAQSLSEETFSTGSWDMTKTN